MPNAVITARYVNPPQEGRPVGSVRDTSGAYWSVSPALLGLFTQNGTYEVQYEDRTSKTGKTFRAVTSVKTVSATSNGARPAPPQQQHDDGLAERIYVCGLLNAWASSGQVPPQVGPLDEATKIARAVWAANYGKKKLPQQQVSQQQQVAEPDDDMNDEIPY